MNLSVFSTSVLQGREAVEEGREKSGKNIMETEKTINKVTNT